MAAEVSQNCLILVSRALGNLTTAVVSCDLLGKPCNPSALSQAHIAAQSWSQLILPSLWSSGAAIQPLVRITFAAVSAHIPFSIPGTSSSHSFGPGRHPRDGYSICYKQGVQTLQHLMATSESPSVTENINFWGETQTSVL